MTRRRSASFVALLAMLVAVLVPVTAFADPEEPSGEPAPEEPAAEENEEAAVTEEAAETDDGADDGDPDETDLTNEDGTDDGGTDGTDEDGTNEGQTSTQEIVASPDPIVEGTPSSPTSTTVGIRPIIFSGANNGGNVQCTELGFANDTHPSGPGGNNYNSGEFATSWPDWITVTVTDGKFVKFETRDGYRIRAVVVKGGKAGNNVYRYPSPGETLDDGLAPPLNPNGSPAGLSNLRFCYEAPTTTTTPTASTTVTVTKAWEDDGGSTVTPSSATASFTVELFEGRTATTDTFVASRSLSTTESSLSDSTTFQDLTSGTEYTVVWSEDGSFSFEDDDGRCNVTPETIFPSTLSFTAGVTSTVPLTATNVVDCDDSRQVVPSKTWEFHEWPGRFSRITDLGDATPTGSTVVDLFVPSTATVPTASWKFDTDGEFIAEVGFETSTVSIGNDDDYRFVERDTDVTGWVCQPVSTQSRGIDLDIRLQVVASPSQSGDFVNACYPEYRIDVDKVVVGTPPAEAEYEICINDGPTASSTDEASTADFFEECVTVGPGGSDSFPNDESSSFDGTLWPGSFLVFEVEPDHSLWESVSYGGDGVGVDGGFQVDLDWRNPVASVTVTNTYGSTGITSVPPSATVTVDKVWEVNGEEVDAPTVDPPSFDVTLSDASGEVDDSPQTVNDGGTARFTGLTRGIEYDVSVEEDETSLPDDLSVFAEDGETCVFVGSTVELSSDTVTAPGSVDATVTNAYDCSAVLGEIDASVDVDIDKVWQAPNGDTIDVPDTVSAAFTVELFEAGSDVATATVTDVEAGELVTFDGLVDGDEYVVEWTETSAPDTFELGDETCTVVPGQSITSGEQSFTAGATDSLSVSFDAVNVYDCEGSDVLGELDEDPTEVERAAEVAYTGSDSGTLLTLGLLLSMIGLAVLRFGRRREQTIDS